MRKKPRSQIMWWIMGRLYMCIYISLLMRTRAHTHTGIIPRSWRRYTVPSGLTVIQWVSNFSERIKQLQHISQQAASQGTKALKVRGEGTARERTGWLGHEVGVNTALTILSHSLPHVDRAHLAGGPVHSRSLHHCHQAIRSPSQQLVAGGTLPRCKHFDPVA